MVWPARIYWVETPSRGRLGVVARPRSVEAFRELKEAGIDVLVSMLEPDEAEDLGLADEALHCGAAGIEFISVSVTDHGTPSGFEAIDEVVDRLVVHLAEGRGVGAHCFAGLGRSPLMVASVLIAHGLSDDEAIERVSEGRGNAVPEMASQHEWLFRYAQRRNG